MHLVGSVGDAQSADVAEKFRKRKVIGDPCASVDLDRAVDNLECNVGNRDFNLGDFTAGALGTNLIEHPGSLESEQTSLLQLDTGIGDQISVAAQFGECFPKGFALKRPPAHEIKRALRCSERPHAMVD